MGRYVKKKVDNFVRKKGKCGHSTGYRGVRKTKGSCTYEARIGIVGERIHLGTYDNAEEAATAYDIISLKLNGDKAKTNFDKSKYVNFLTTLDSFELNNLVGAIKDQTQFLSKLLTLECKENAKGGSSSTLTSTDAASYQNDDQSVENDCQQTLIKLLENLNNPTRQKRRKRKHQKMAQAKNQVVQDNSQNFEIFQNQQVHDQMSSEQNDFLTQEDDLQQFIESTPAIWNLDDDEVLGKSICDQQLTMEGEHEEEFDESTLPSHQSPPLLLQQQIGDDLLQQQVNNDFRLYYGDVLTSSGRSEFYDLSSQNPILADVGFCHQQPLENGFQDYFQSRQNACILNSDCIQVENATLRNYGRQNFWGNYYRDETLGCPSENYVYQNSRAVDGALLNFQNATYQPSKHYLTGNYRVTTNFCGNLNQRDFVGEEIDLESFQQRVELEQQQQLMQQQQQQQYLLLRKQQQNENQLLIQKLYGNSPIQENTFCENIY